MVRRRYVLNFLVLCGLLLVLGIGDYAIRPTKALSDNLLVNGNFDELPFDWYYPNHFVARGWDRWWIHGTVLPEYDDVAKPGGVRVNTYVDGGHAQVYFKWGSAYTAGIFQVVNGLTPCRPYELTMYARTHSLDQAHPGSRIGLDPQGEQLTPDGAVKDMAPLERTVWSREQTALSFWEELSVTAEPLGNSLTAILYASPAPGSDAVHYFDTYWDAGALRAAIYANGRLPGPTHLTTSFINNVTPITSPTSLTLNWSLSDTAGTQVWYNIVPPPTPPTPITSTFQINFLAYMPIAARGIPFNFPQQTALDYATGLTHSATISDLSSGEAVSYVVVARRLVGNTCVTEYAGPYIIQIP
ncbi:MAG: hypothetical protein JXR84_16770 [Anaerolineae bacterium]|nr:hypothetical protein [Anaerolineae bacterium]